MSGSGVDLSSTDLAAGLVLRAQRTARAECEAKALIRRHQLLASRTEEARGGMRAIAAVVALCVGAPLLVGLYRLARLLQGLAA